MLSSDPRVLDATPWSLDEFPLTDIFPVAPSRGTADAPCPAIEAEHPEADSTARMVIERNRIEAEAYARGRTDAERDAQVRLKETILNAASALNQAALSVQMHEARWLSNIEENVVALAILVARHVVQREIITDHSLMTDLAVRAIAQHPVGEEITLRMHPDDLSVCRPILDEATASGAIAYALRWIADPCIQRGGCIAEGRERIIDGRVDTALERSYRTLAEIHA